MAAKTKPASEPDLRALKFDVIVAGASVGRIVCKNASEPGQTPIWCIVGDESGAVYYSIAQAALDAAKKGTNKKCS